MKNKNIFFQAKAIFNINGKQVKLFRNKDQKEEVTSHTVSDVLSLHAKLLYAV